MTERPAKRMDGRIAVVTGGAQGIGFGIARRFAEEGAHVVIADIKEAVAKGAAAKINAAGGTACGCVVDIGDDASVAALAAKIEAMLRMRRPSPPFFSSGTKDRVMRMAPSWLTRITS